MSHICNYNGHAGLSTDIFFNFSFSHGSCDYDLLVSCLPEAQEVFSRNMMNSGLWVCRTADFLVMVPGDIKDLKLV